MPSIKDSLTGEGARPVIILDANGDQVTSFSGGGGGSGTEYTEGATDATITGTAILWEDAADTLVTVNSSKPLPVSVASVPSHAVTNAGTFAVQAAQSGTWTVQPGNTANTTAWKVDGSAVTQPVSIASLPALAAGTNAIGKLAANSGVDIGDVDVTSIIPGTGATNLGKAIDSAAGSTDTGVAPLAIRDDALTTLSPAEGDWAPLRVDANGSLWVQLAGALASTTDSIAIKPPATQVKKSYNTTSQQTGADVWSPASGKKIRVSNLIIGTYGTTAGRLILWFGANADTTYSEGTDEALFKASFAPSSTAKPGAVVTFTPPFEATTADHELHITTDAALSVDIVVVGYEE